MRYRPSLRWARDVVRRCAGGRAGSYEALAQDVVMGEDFSVKVVARRFGGRDARGGEEGLARSEELRTRARRR